MDVKHLITTALAAKAYKKLKKLNVDETVKTYLFQTYEQIDSLKKELDNRIDDLEKEASDLRLIGVTSQDLDSIKEWVEQKVKADIEAASLHEDKKEPMQSMKGKDGIGINEIYLSGSEMIVVLDNDKTINLGPIIPESIPGIQGEKGADGKDGVGIVSTLIENNELIFTLSDGTQLNVGNIKGPQGDPGLPPKHEWDNTRLRFKNPDGTWGKWVDLRGPAGKDGRSSGGGATVVKQGGSNLEISNQGLQISSNVSAINFTGDAIVTQTSSGKVDVNITSGGGIGFATIVATTDITLQNDTIHITSSPNDLNLTLPETASIGSIIKILMYGSGNFLVKQNENQQIHFGKVSTNLGTSGDIKTTQAKSTLELICVVPNNEWIVSSSVGNFIINSI